MSHKKPDIKDFAVIKKKEKIANKDYKVVKCYWHDIATQGGWLEKKEVDAISTSNAITYGLLVEETDDYVKISASVTLEEEPDYADVTIIPKSVVLCVKELDTFNRHKEQAKATCFKNSKLKK